jgi:hypothetical protein
VPVPALVEECAAKSPSNLASYSKEHIRYKCNQHKVRGMQVHYKSAEKYVGDDALDLLVLLPTPAQL